MIVIKEQDFEMVQSSKTGPFFDLNLPTKINEGKDNERIELKLFGHGLPFETCMKYIVGYKMGDLSGTYSISEYIEKYKKVIDEVSDLIQIVDWPKRSKKEVEDGTIEE